MRAIILNTDQPMTRMTRKPTSSGTNCADQCRERAWPGGLGRTSDPQVRASYADAMTSAAARIALDLTADLPVSGLEDFYRDLHRHPELSGEEHRTAGKLVERFAEAGVRHP